MILKHKEASAQSSDEGDTVQAFVALGGKPDKSGKISSDKLRATIKVCVARCWLLCAQLTPPQTSQRDACTTLLPRSVRRSSA